MDTPTTAVAIYLLLGPLVGVLLMSVGLARLFGLKPWRAAAFAILGQFAAVIFLRHAPRRPLQ
jgi:positive regulator of sigma E activity